MLNALQAIAVTEELLQGDAQDDEEALHSSSAAAPAAERPVRQGPKIVLTQAPTIQLSSVLPATVRLTAYLRYSGEQLHQTCQMMKSHAHQHVHVRLSEAQDARADVMELGMLTRQGRQDTVCLDPCTSRAAAD